MSESSPDNMQIKDVSDDNLDDSVARTNEWDDSDSVTHTVHVNNEMLIHLKTELDDDIPPPPPVVASSHSNSDNVAVYQNNFETLQWRRPLKMMIPTQACRRNRSSFRQWGHWEADS